jgi:putative FmdB family regulatory protein
MMPNYEYQCDTCEHKFEIFQHMNDKPIKICPKCGKKVHRLITGGTGFILKGTGWTPKGNK